MWLRSVRSALVLSTDVFVVLGYVLVVELLFSNLMVLPQTVRALLGLPLVFFLPGYALLMVLFPGRASRSRLRIHGAVAASPLTTGSTDVRAGLTWVDRFVLSFGTSIALLPVLGLGLSISGLGFAPETIVNTLGVLTVGGVLLGSVRRLQLPPEERFYVPVLDWLDEYSTALFDADTPLDAVLNVVLVFLVVVSISTLAYGVVAMSSAESYSEITLLQETGDGEFVASGYPREFTVGQGQQLVVGIDNYEGEQVTYTVVSEFQRVGPNGQILERDSAGQFTVSVEAGGSKRVTHTATPDLSGEDVKLVYYLYRTTPPDNPSPESAYRSVHIWVDVAGPGTAGADAGGEGTA